MKRAKTMLITFFDSKMLIHLEYVPFGQTVNATFYLTVLKRLVVCIHRVRLEYHKPRGWFLLYDKAKPHTAHIIQQNFQKIKLMYLIFHPTRRIWYHQLFFISESQIGDDVNAIQAVVTRHFKAIPIDEYAHSFESLYHRFKNCITCGKVYVEA